MQCFFGIAIGILLGVRTMKFQRQFCLEAGENMSICDFLFFVGGGVILPDIDGTLYLPVPEERSLLQDKLLPPIMLPWWKWWMNCG